MKTYAIKNAITSTEYGPSVDFDKAYDEDHEFMAANDDEAIDIANDLQVLHDDRYMSTEATDDDFENAPCYVDCLYEVTEDSERKVEQ